MTTHPLRRSGRIPKRIAIVLQGTDTTGRFFSEETHTVVLSRHGAGVVSVNKPGPDEPLSIAIPGTDKKADVRLVGRMGGDSSNFIYGLAFLDSTIDFWEIDFPPAFQYTVELENSGEAILLECCLCQSVQQMSDSEIDADVYAINQNILMYCETCATTSIWKRARTKSTRNRLSTSGTLPTSPRRADLPAFVSRLTTAPVAGGPAVKPIPVAPYPVASATVVQRNANSFTAVVETAITTASKFFPPPETLVTAEVHLADSPSSVSAQSAVSTGAHSTNFDSAHSQSTEEPSTGSVAVQTASPASDISLTSAVSPNSHASRSDAPSRSTETIPLPPLQLSQEFTLPPPPAPRPPNRRKDVRTRVTFTACIRNTAGGDEIVECDNISRSGFSFRSRSCYAEGSRIEAAVPFSPGGHAIFVYAHIQRVEELPGGLFRHGASYDRNSLTT